MLGICLHGQYLTFAAMTEEGDSRVIDQTGIVEYPIPLTKKDLLSSNSVQDLIGIFRDLRNELEFPQNRSRLSLSPDLLTIRMAEASPEVDDAVFKEEQSWENSVRIGQDTHDMLRKQRVISRDEKGKTLVSVYFYPKLLENIMEAAEFTRLGITAVDIAPFAAYDTVRKNYDLGNYGRHSVLHFDANRRVTLSIYDATRLVKYCRFAAYPDGPVFYSTHDRELFEAASMISMEKFDNILYLILGPTFVHADRQASLRIQQIIHDTYYMELINPFVNYNIFNKARILEGKDVDLLNDNLYTEVAGTLFRGIESHD